MNFSTLVIISCFITPIESSDQKVPASSPRNTSSSQIGHFQKIEGGIKSPPDSLDGTESSARAEVASSYYRYCKRRLLPEEEFNMLANRVLHELPAELICAFTDGGLHEQKFEKEKIVDSESNKESIGLFPSEDVLRIRCTENSGHAQSVNTNADMGSVDSPQYGLVDVEVEHRETNIRIRWIPETDFIVESIDTLIRIADQFGRIHEVPFESLNEAFYVYHKEVMSKSSCLTIDCDDWRTILAQVHYRTVVADITDCRRFQKQTEKLGLVIRGLIEVVTLPSYTSQERTYPLHNSEHKIRDISAGNRGRLGRMVSAIFNCGSAQDGNPPESRRARSHAVHGHMEYDRSDTYDNRMNDAAERAPTGLLRVRSLETGISSFVGEDDFYTKFSKPTGREVEHKYKEDFQAFQDKSMNDIEDLILLAEEGELAEGLRAEVLSRFKMMANTFPDIKVVPENLLEISRLLDSYEGSLESSFIETIQSLIRELVKVRDIGDTTSKK